MTMASKASCRSAGTLASLGVFAGAILAHPTDELAQASYVEVGREKVSVELDLTPGEQLAEKYVASLDKNKDGALSPAEQEGYAAQVLGELRLSLDGAALAPILARSEFPSATALRSRGASVKLFIDAPLPPLAPGKHVLRYENRHAPLKSGYLAVLLFGKEGQVVGTQTHDETQQTLTLTFMTPPPPLSPLLILGVGLLALGAVVALRQRRRRPSP
jgi:MYXO-CTERM domain-containing protein